MKKCVVVSFVLLIVFTGCQGTSTERINMLSEWMVEAKSVSQQLDEQAQRSEILMKSLQAALADPNLSSEQTEKISENIGIVLTKLVEYKMKKSEVDLALVKWETEIDALKEAGDVTFGDELSAWGSGVTAAAPMLGPVAPWALAIGSILGAVGTGMRSAKKTAAVKTTLTDVVTSVNNLIESDVVTNVDLAKSVLKDHQTPMTIATIRNMLNPSYPAPR